MRDGLKIVSIAGRGDGLVATRTFAVGERIFIASAFGYAQYRREARQCCAQCMCFGEDERLLIHCPGGCGACYCSAECQRADELSGHKFCCGALKRIQMLPVGTARDAFVVRSAAEFLLRAFAARRAAAGAAHDTTSAATFEAALAQHRDNPRCTPGYAERESQREQAVELAMKHGGALLPLKRRADAMGLLRGEHCNSFCWRDDLGQPQGWAIYPEASILNHSCWPNTAYIVDGRRLIFEAIRPIAVGDDLSICYVRLPENDGTAEWGFCCECERCDGRVGVEAIAAFDAVHLCPCGSLTTAAMKAAAMAAKGGPACQCETRSRLMDRGVAMEQQ